MPYDIGKITRELQSDFRLFTNYATWKRNDIELALVDDGNANRATPENVGRLLVALQNLTRDIEAARATMSDWLPDIGVVLWDGRFKQWQERLATYEGEVAKAPPGDRGDILWSVTAPLLLGLFGGENSDEPQQPIDAVTPFMLANQLEVADAWRDERWRLFKDDLEAQALKVIPWGAVVLVPIFAWGAWAALKSWNARRGGR